MIEIKPIKNLNAVIKAPPSKSYTNRALIIASLANGKSVLSNVLFSDDTIYMINALKEFGIKILQKNTQLEVYGTDGNLKSPKKKVYAGNAGTTMRFLTAFSALVKGRVIIAGDKRMQERPIQDLLDVLKQAGIKAYSMKNNGCPPVGIEGGSFAGGKVKIKGEISSQFLSAIMMIAPYAKKELSIEVIGKMTSKPYVDITMDVMKNFGAKAINRNYQEFIMKNKKYSPRDYFIEGDASSASYFLSAGAITKGKVKVTGINPDSVQGDIRFADILEKMGCKVEKGRDFIVVNGANLNGITVDMNSMPDTVQTLAITALFAKGKTKIYNIGNLRVKETDRLRALSNELKKLGAEVREFEDGIEITPKRLHGAVIDTYNDHRMAMSFAVAGMMIPEIKIKNPECVKKSFPDFWERLKELYIKN